MMKKVVAAAGGEDRLWLVSVIRESRADVKVHAATAEDASAKVKDKMLNDSNFIEKVDEDMGYYDETYSWPIGEDELEYDLSKIRCPEIL